MLSPDAPKPRWRRWTARDRLGWIAMGAVAIVVAGLLVFSINQKDAPARVVSDYLTAISERDVDRALDFVTNRADGSFLTAAAISSGWRVADVSVRADSSESHATVDATISGPNGVQAGVFDVNDDGAGWRITNPFAKLEFNKSSFDYYEINGQRSSWESEGMYLGIPVFPGVYRFHSSSRDRVTTGAAAVTVMPNSETYKVDEKIAVRPQLTAKGLGDVQREVRRRIAECATYTMLSPRNCPFAWTSSDGLKAPNGDQLENIRDIRWTVMSQPTVAAGQAASDDETAVTVTTPKLGQVRLTATGYSAEARRRLPVTLTCGIDPVGRVVFAADGSISIEYGQLIPPTPAEPRTTCK